jgi:hypothetical protein
MIMPRQEQLLYMALNILAVIVQMQLTWAVVLAARQYRRHKAAK